MIEKYPESKCPACGGDTWWCATLDKGYHGEPAWLCGSCHPPATEEIKLLMRIVKGNHVLSKANYEIAKIQDPALEANARVQWGQALQKLTELGKELKKISMNVECPYIEKSKKMKGCILVHPNVVECHCCPATSNYWWEQELFDLDKKKHPEVWK